MFEGLVAHISFEAGVGLLVLAEQPAAPLLFGRILARVLVEVAAVVNVAWFLQVDAHEVLIGIPDPAGNRAEGRGGHDQDGREGQQAVHGHRHRGMQGSQRRGSQEAEHSTGLTQSVEAVRYGGLAADDVCQAAAGKGHDEEANADPVVAPPVRRLAEQPEGTDEKHERQQKRHPAERAVDNREHSVGEPSLETPPREGCNKDAQGEVEEGGTVPAVLGGNVADVVADPADAAADNVPYSQPGACGHPHEPRLPGFDGGHLAGACRAR
ncbi:hypothetical protein D9M72_369010 [compost metagenome]